MSKDSGSVFIEAMIAAAIVAMSLAAMYHSIEQSARYSRMIDEKRTALLIAQSHLASVGSAVPIVQGMTGGLDGPYAWSINIAPQGSDASDAGQLWQVTVAVREANGGGGDLAVLQTLELAPAG